MSYVIACSKIWDESLIEKLKSEFDGEFHLITKREELTIENLRKIKAEKVFLPHWSYIIKPEIYNNFECVIFHMTNLPYGRGGSPLQNLIALGHTHTKISAIKCSDGIDTGPVYLKEDLNLNGTAQDIFIRASAIIKDMIIKLLKTSPEPVAQVGEVFEFKRRKEEDGNLENLQTLDQVYNYIRMLDAEGYPRAFIKFDNVRYEFENVSYVKNNELVATVRIKIK